MGSSTQKARSVSLKINDEQKWHLPIHNASSDTRHRQQPIITKKTRTNKLWSTLFSTDRRSFHQQAFLTHSFTGHSSAGASEEWRISFIRGTGEMTARRPRFPSVAESQCSQKGWLSRSEGRALQLGSAWFCHVLAKLWYQWEICLNLWSVCSWWCVGWFTDTFSEGVSDDNYIYYLKWNVTWNWAVWEKRGKRVHPILFWSLRILFNPSKCFHKHPESFQEDSFYFVVVCLFGFLLGEITHEGAL